MNAPAFMTTPAVDYGVAYVPALIIRRAAAASGPITEPIGENYDAAVLFADISGFTTLTERLAERGAAGIEELSKVISEYFGALVEVIVDHGGDIVKFAGDALLAVWPVQPGEDLALATRRAAQCALAVQAAMRDFASRATAQLELKVALGAGPVNCMHVGGVFGRWELLIAGEPFLQAGRAGHHAKPGDVVISREAIALLEEGGEGAPTEDGTVHLKFLFSEAPRARLQMPVLGDVQTKLLLPYVPAAIRTKLGTAAAAWIAELRRITVLFVNLPGISHTTPLADVQRMMRDLQTTLYKYEGSVNKLNVDDKGVTFVAVLGLPPLAHEDDPVRGLQAAMALRNVLKKHNLSTAIGVTTGRAYCGSVGSLRRCEYTIMGDVVNLAARLMQAAPDSVLCDHETFEAAAGALKFETLAPIKVKGKAEPVKVYRPLEQVTATVTAQPRSMVAIIGRRAELALLAAQIRNLAKGNTTAVVVIEGEAGSGKSRLLEEVQARAEEFDLTYAIGAADSIERTTPYHAWRGVFSSLLGLDGIRDPQARRDHINELLAPMPELHRLAPLLNSLLPLDLPEDGITAQMHGEVRASNLHELMLGILRNAAAGSPLLLVIEDAHWKDSASWAFTLLAVRNIKRLLLIIATRPMSGQVPPEFLQVAATPGTTRIKLDMLSPEDAVALASRRLGVRALPPPVAKLIAEKAGGNPFFTEELAYDLRDAGHLIIENGECTLAPGVDVQSISLPDNVEGIVSERIDRLTADQQLALKVASVVGRTFLERTLRNVHPVESAKPKIDDHLNALKVVDLTVDVQSTERSYIFKHIITQQVAYNSMLFAQRRGLHQSIAVWHEKEYANDLAPVFPTLAHHYTRAEDGPKAIDYLERAGTRALGNFANEEAISFFNQALTLAEKTPGLAAPVRRGFWNSQVGEAYYAMGRQSESREYFDRALTLFGHPPPGPMWRHLTSLMWGALVQTVHRLFPRRFIGSASPAHRDSLLHAARANERLCQIYYIENAKVQSMNGAITALNLSEIAGPSPELARGYGNVIVTTAVMLAYKLSDMYERLAMTMGAEVGNIASLAYSCETAGLYHAGAGHRERTEARLAESIAFADRIGDRRRWDEAKFLSAIGSLTHGRLDEARARFNELYASGRRNAVIQVQLWALSGRVAAAMIMGGDADAVSLLDALLTEHADKGVGFARADTILAFGTIAQAHFRAGDIHKARLAAERVVRIMAETETIAVYLLPGYQGLGEVLTGLFAKREGDGKAERKMIGTMISTYVRFSLMYPVARPMTYLWRGVFARLEGRTKKARRLIEKSIAVAKRLDMPSAAEQAARELARAD